MEFSKKSIVILVISLIPLLLSTRIRIILGAGVSMYPTYPKFKLLLCVKQKEYKVNDIIFYKLDKHNVVHRIISVIDDGVVTQYQTKGDGNKNKDRYLITKTNIVCKIV